MPSSVFSIPEAVELGRFVLAAYDLFAANDPTDFAPSAGYTLAAKLYADDLTSGLPVYKVFGFIARSGTDVVVAIRGTEGVFEWLIDILFVPILFPFLNAGKTERGFTNFYSTFRIGPADASPRVVEALRELVADGSVQTLRITAPSLGSALATMLAFDAAGNGAFKTLTVYTFASPRAGDKVFAGTYDDLVPDSWRVSNLNDIIPQLPPQFAGYVHVVSDFPINSDDRTRHNVRCWHSLLTYLNTLDASAGLDLGCAPR
jgi:predicted lipase